MGLKRRWLLWVFLPTALCIAVAAAGFALYAWVTLETGRVFAAAFALCAGLSALLALLPSSPLLAAVCLSLLYAGASLINTAALSIFPLRFADSGAVASVSGLMDFVTYLGAAAGAAAYGLLIAGHRYAPVFFSWTLLSLLSLWSLPPCAKSPLAPPAPPAYTPLP